MTIPRFYLFEIEDLAATSGDVGYSWQAGKVRVGNSVAHLTCLIVLPG